VREDLIAATYAVVDKTRTFGSCAMTMVPCPTSAIERKAPAVQLDKRLGKRQAEAG
jgi:hypothetical protein